MELAFDRSQGQAQSFRGLLLAHLLEVAEPDHRLVRYRKLLEQFGENAVLLFARAFLLRTGPRINEGHGKRPQVILRGVRINRAGFGMRLPLAQFRAHGVQQNAVHPRGELGAPFELPEVLEGGEQGILHRILGILGIPKHVRGGAVKPGHPGREQLLERGGITQGDGPAHSLDWKTAG